MYRIHPIIKIHLLSHLILCGFVGLSATLHATTSIEHPYTPENYHCPPQKFPQHMHNIPQKTHLDIEEMPDHLASACNAMPIHRQPHHYSPHLLTMRTYNPTTEYYSTHFFSNHGLLHSKEAPQTAHKLNYRSTTSPISPAIQQIPPFLIQQSKKNEYGPPKASEHPLSYPQTTGYQRQHWHKIAPTATLDNTLYSTHFSHQQRPMTTTPVSHTCTTQAYPNHHPHCQDHPYNYARSYATPAPPLPNQQHPRVHTRGALQKKTHLVQWFIAAKTGNSKKLKKLYNNYKISVNTSNKGKYTALLLSAYKGHLDCIKFLIQQGAELHHKNEKGYTALLSSTENGHLDCLKYLIAEGGNIHEKNKWGNTALLLSTYKGQLNCIKYLLQQGADIHHKNEKGYTALLSSAEKGHLNCLTCLCQQGANVHAKNKWGNTALLLSAYTGQLNCVTYLLQQGADIHHKNKKGYTALLLSTENGHLDCLKLLQAQGANIHDRNNWGSTPLILSAYEGQLHCLKYLVQQGALIDAKNQCGSTALILSVYKRHLACSKYLHQQGANINAADKRRYTALLLSARHGYLDGLKYLLLQGADIHAKNKWQNTPLLLSAYNGHLDCIKYLVEQGAHIHHKNKNGNTALLWSAYKGHLDCLKYLVKQGAHIQDKNDNGNTPLLLSAQQGHVDCLNFLLTSVELRNTSLQGINLSQATLPTDLSSVNFTGTTLPEALSGKKFTDAKLPKDLSNRNLTGADLSGHHFTHTNLEGTQLEGAIFTNTLCDYQQCFQDHAKANKLKDDQYQWYYDNLPKDLKSIALVYPHLSLDSHKAELLQIASGLAYLPYWKDIEFNIKVQYWSCQLILLKKKFRSDLGALLTCTLENSLYGLNYEIENYCWQTDYPQYLVEQAKELPHDDFDQYLRAFQAGLQQYNCQSKENWGHYWYKDNIEKNIQGLQKTYPKLTNPKYQQEAIDIAAHLSTLYQYQRWDLLLRYLSLQNRLIKLKISAGVAVSNGIHYDKYQ